MENKEMRAQVNDAECSINKNVEPSEDCKVRAMRAILETQDPTSKEVDDVTIRRFLRARDLDVNKASDFLLKYLKWRREFVPDGSISESGIEYELSQKKVFLQGLDKKERPVVVIIGRRHIPIKGKEGLEEYKRLIVYSLDKVCACMPKGSERFVVIADLEGWQYSNSDIHGYVEALSILQDFYPERLGKLFIIHSPYLFMTIYKIVYPFIDKNTRKKIVFVENKNLKSRLLQEIDEKQLPDIYGGKLSLVPIEESKSKD